MSSIQDGALVRHIGTVEAILDGHASALAGDLAGYRNHVYRVVHLGLAIAGDRGALEKIAVAAAFHDLGIWTHQTFDYIEPSIGLARAHLAATGRADWISEVERMIADHHKITPLTDPQSLVDIFRRADWVDVTCGLRRFGLPRSFIGELFATWPSAGFHRRLVTLSLARFCRHPLSPLPMVKW